MKATVSMKENERHKIIQKENSHNFSWYKRAAKHRPGDPPSSVPFTATPFLSVLCVSTDVTIPFKEVPRKEQKCHTTTCTADNPSTSHH